MPDRYEDGALGSLSNRPSMADLSVSFLDGRNIGCPYTPYIVDGAAGSAIHSLTGS
jgi:hypothetical protein